MTYHLRFLTVEQRFWLKVNKLGRLNLRIGRCWEWVGAKGRGGYGLFRGDGECLAHRFSYRLENGPIPEGLDVMHRCDNPACVRPAHLQLGTDLDNRRDSEAKGRPRNLPKGNQHYTRLRPELALRGSSVGTSKLSEADVADIKHRLTNARWGDKTAEKLALQYQVSVTHIHRIRAGDAWGHV